MKQMNELADHDFISVDAYKMTLQRLFMQYVTVYCALNNIVRVVRLLHICRFTFVIL